MQGSRLKRRSMVRQKPCKKLRRKGRCGPTGRIRSSQMDLDSIKKMQESELKILWIEPEMLPQRPQILWLLLHLSVFQKPQGIYPYQKAGKAASYGLWEGARREGLCFRESRSNGCQY